MSACIASTATRQELLTLRATREEFLAEKHRLDSQLQNWKSQITDKKGIVASLEATLRELQNPDGQHTGSAGPLLDEELSGRFVTAVTTAPFWRAQVPSEMEIKRQFGFEGDPGSSLEPEERLGWELLNFMHAPSPRLDHHLLSDLRRAGRTVDGEFLIAASGPPSMQDRELRPLLWLWKHPQLDITSVVAGDDVPLILACRAGFASVSRELCARSSPQCEAALITAVRAGHAECAKVMLDAKVDANIRDESGEPLLFLANAAASAGDSSQAVALVALLLDYSADPCAQSKGTPILSFAAARGDDAVCAALLNAGADESLQEASGRTAAQSAAEGGFVALDSRLVVMS